MRFQMVMTAKALDADVERITTIFNAPTWAAASEWADKFLENFQSAEEFESVVTKAKD